MKQSQGRNNRGAVMGTQQRPGVISYEKATPKGVARTAQRPQNGPWQLINTALLPSGS